MLPPIRQKVVKKQALRRVLWTALNGVKRVVGGEKEDRTPDLRIANSALSQLSYPPTIFGLSRRFRLSAARRLRRGPGLYRECGVVVFEVAVVLLPVGHHPPFAPFCKQVMRGAVGVAVDEQAGVVAGHDLRYGVSVDVHDGHRRLRFVLVAFAAQFARDGKTSSARQRVADDAEEVGAQDASSALIPDVVGAQLVSVQQQRGATVEVDDRLLIEQGHACGPGKLAANHEVAVAARHKDFRAAVGKCFELRDDFQRIGVTREHRVA